MSYLGDIRLGDTLDLKFTTTAASTGAPTTLSGTPVISAYPSNSTTELTAGITLTADFDARTGLNHVRVVASSGNGYATATNYELVITTGTVGGTSAVGYVVGTFSIENRSALMPTTAARTLDVASTGEAGIDLGNILLPVGAIPALAISDNGTAQSATGTTLVMRSAAAFGDNTCKGNVIAAFGSTQGYWQFAVVDSNVGSTDTLTISPAWGVTPSGTITYILFGSPPASTGSIPAVNATQIGSQTASASGTITFPSATLASTTNITAGTITTVTNLTNAPTAGDFTATMKTSIGTAVAASAVASVTGNVGGNVVGSVGSVTTVSDKTGYTLSNAGIDALFTRQLTEAYAADGVAPTVAQALMLIQQTIGDFSITGTTLTAKKLDGSTTAATYTLDSSTAPTSRTRAT